jgi:hypothetical protein
MGTNMQSVHAGLPNFALLISLGVAIFSQAKRACELGFLRFYPYFYDVLIAFC